MDLRGRLQPGDQLRRLYRALALYEIDPTNGNVLSLRHVVGEVDDEINEETDDVLWEYTYTADPEDTATSPAE